MEEGVVRVKILVLLLRSLKQQSYLLSLSSGLLLLSELGTLMRMALRHVTTQRLSFFKILVFANRTSKKLLFGRIHCVFSCYIHLFNYIFWFLWYSADSLLFGWMSRSQCFPGHNSSSWRVSEGHIFWNVSGNIGEAIFILKGYLDPLSEWA